MCPCRGNGAAGPVTIGVGTWDGQRSVTQTGRELAALLQERQLPPFWFAGSTRNKTRQVVGFFSPDWERHPNGQRDTVVAGMF